MSTPTSVPPKQLDPRGLIAVATLFVVGCIEIFGGGLIAGMGGLFVLAETLSPTTGEFHGLAETMRNVGAIVFVSVGPLVLGGLVLEGIAWKTLVAHRVTKRLAVMVAASRLVWVPLLCLMALAALGILVESDSMLLVPEFIAMLLVPPLTGLAAFTAPVLATWFARSDL